MATHNFTAEQMKKFFEAVGAHTEPQIEVGRHTTEQLLGMADSRGGLRDWPSVTDDPRINYAVDCVVELDAFGRESDYEEPKYDENLYTDEVAAWKELKAASQS